MLSYKNFSFSEKKKKKKKRNCKCSTKAWILCPCPQNPIFSKNLSLQVRYLISLQNYTFTSIHFRKINLQYFAILLDNNIIVAMQYLKTMIIFKNFCEKKTFYQTIKFEVEKRLKKWGSIISGRLQRVLTNEIKTLLWPFPR